MRSERVSIIWDQKGDGSVEAVQCSEQIFPRTTAEVSARASEEPIHTHVLWICRLKGLSEELQV